MSESKIICMWNYLANFSNNYKFDCISDSLTKLTSITTTGEIDLESNQTESEEISEFSYMKWLLVLGIGTSLLMSFVRCRQRGRQRAIKAHNEQVKRDKDQDQEQVQVQVQVQDQDQEQDQEQLQEFVKDADTSVIFSDEAPPAIPSKKPSQIVPSILSNEYYETNSETETETESEPEPKSKPKPKSIPFRPIKIKGKSSMLTLDEILSTSDTNSETDQDKISETTDNESIASAESEISSVPNLENDDGSIHSINLETEESPLPSPLPSPVPSPFSLSYSSPSPLSSLSPLSDLDPIKDLNWDRLHIKDENENYRQCRPLTTYY